MRLSTNCVNTIPVRLPVVNTVEVIGGEPIEVVDYVSLSLLNLGSSAPVHVPSQGSTANVSYIAPAIRQGQERISDGTVPGSCSSWTPITSHPQRAAAAGASPR